MFAGLDLHGTANITGITYGPVGTFSSVNGVQTLNHGSAHLRRNATYAANLVNGNFSAIAANLNSLRATSSATSGLLQTLPTDPSTGQLFTDVSGRVLRNGDGYGHGNYFAAECSGGNTARQPRGKQDPGSGNMESGGNLSKTFRITESKSIQIRVDATNVLNHPQPANPNLAVPGTSDFGAVTTKGGLNNGTPRMFQGQLRFSF
jgi:hypothetical protein